MLQANGHSVWWDTSLQSGEAFRDAINRELDAADAVVVIWTPQSVKSEWVLSEAETGRRLKKLVTLRTRDVEPWQFPRPFDTLHTLFVDDHVAILTDLARFGLGSPSAPPTTTNYGTSADERLFAEVEKAGTAEALQFYLDEFPQGAHAPIVRFRLKAAQGQREQQQREAAENQQRAQAVRRSAEGRIKVDTKIVHGAPDGWFKPGAGKQEWFKDHEHGPEMVVVPAGSYTMGSPANEPQRYDNETQVKVTIPAPFAVGRFAVTFAEWDACVADGGCGGYKPGDERWGRGKHPVINVNWDDAQAYVAWLSQKTGHAYRLLSEAEWEYAARAGTTTPFWWGTAIMPAQANYDGSVDPYAGGGSKGEYRQRTVPVDSFQANPWGLYNVHGNVWEWSEDWWNDSNSGNPGDGTARLSGDGSRRVLRGGSWFNLPLNLRSAYRIRFTTDYRFNLHGFRVGRTLTP